MIVAVVWSLRLSVTINTFLSYFILLSSLPAHDHKTGIQKDAQNYLQCFMQCNFYTVAGKMPLQVLSITSILISLALHQILWRKTKKREMTVAAHKRAICCATRQTDSKERRATAYSSQNCVPTDKSQKNWTACRFEYGHTIYHVHQSAQVQVQQSSIRAGSQLTTRVQTTAWTAA